MKSPLRIKHFQPWMISKILVLLTVTGSLAAAKKPNILFIAIDDLRPELGCYGGKQVKTPRIDQLASEGIRFDRAYCQVPICMGSRASMLTGILPTLKRFDGDCRVEKDVPGAATLPETFRKAGYTTLSVGKIFHSGLDTAERSWSKKPWKPGLGHMQSYDPETNRRLSKRKQRGRIFEAPEVEDDAYADGLVAKRAIEDLRRLKKAGKPFFLAAGFIRPHMPFYAPKRYWDLYERDKIEIATNRFRSRGAPKALRGSKEYTSYHLGDFKAGTDDFHRMMRHGYLATTSYADKLTGDILDELKRLGLEGNTIVIIWGDHGWHLGEHEFWGKHNTMHLATRVPLIVKVLGKTAGATASLVENIDIFPTLCELAGVEVPASVHGRSFVRLLDKLNEPFREVAYSRFRSADAVITERYSYTLFQDDQGEMLYDLVDDPDENQNIAGQPKAAKTVKKMRELLKKRQAESATVEGKK